MLTKLGFLLMVNGKPFVSHTYGSVMGHVIRNHGHIGKFTNASSTDGPAAGGAKGLMAQQEPQEPWSTISAASFRCRQSTFEEITGR